MKKTIQELCVEYGCDKTPEITHSYSLDYDRLFKDLKNVTKVLEIGVGYPALMNKYINQKERKYNYKTGVSLYIWREYFPEAMIYGIDIHPDAVVEGEERIKTFLGNSTDAEWVKKFGEEFGPFDIIIEDGSHHLVDQIKTAQNFLPYVKDGGMYFTEDLRYFREMIANFPGRELEMLGGGRDDRLLLIRC